MKESSDGYKFTDAYDIVRNGVAVINLERAFKSEAFCQRMNKLACRLIDMSISESKMKESRTKVPEGVSSVRNDATGEIHALKETNIRLVIYLENSIKALKESRESKEALEAEKAKIEDLAFSLCNAVDRYSLHVPAAVMRTADRLINEISKLGGPIIPEGSKCE